MRTYDAYMEVGKVGPKQWIKDAYLRLDVAIEPLMKLGLTETEIKEMEDYLENTDDELSKAIWLIVGGWMMFENR